MNAPRTVVLILAPVPGRPSYYRTTDAAGRVVVQASRQPLLDAARALAAPGVPPETIVTASHRGAAIVAIRTSIGEAAKWRIEESDRGGLKRRPWRPFDPDLFSAHGVAENGRAAVPAEDRAPGAPLPIVRGFRVTHGCTGNQSGGEKQGQAGNLVGQCQAHS